LAANAKEMPLKSPERKEGVMKLPHAIEFHEDIRLFIYRPRVSLDEEIRR
jgi:hypothetical protein